MLLGVFVVMLPTALIGVCASPDMICNAIMKPTLILSGTLIVALSLGVTVMASRIREEVSVLKEAA
jgi:hypothetical protein